MKFLTCAVAMAVAGLSQAAVAADDAADVSGELRKWHQVTLTFTGPNSAEDASPNPFRDYRLSVTFQHAKTGKKHVVPGFFAADGNAAQTGAAAGDKWRVHFLPVAEGTWTYAASFRTGKDVAISEDPQAGEATAFDGHSGRFEIGPTNKTGRDHRGQGLLQYVDQHYLRFAETGEWFLKGGADSPENFLAYAGFDGTWSSKGGKPRKGEALAKGLHRYEPHAGDWRDGDPTWKDGQGKGIVGALNYLSSQGMNSIYFLTMNVGGDGKDVWPWVEPNARDRFDCSKLDQWEIVFSHMDRLGILLHVITQEQENDQLLDGGGLGIERKLYYRELIARFAHHHALVWNLGEENTNTDEQRRQFCTYIRQLDPCDHPIVCHTFPGKYDAVYQPLLGFEHFEGPSLQTNDTHNQTVRWRLRSAQTTRPWFVCLDEIGPAHTGVKPDKDDPDHDDVRTKHLWGNLMGGGAGCEWYFGYKYAHNDLNCEDFRSRENVWRQTRYALEFFHAHLPFWEMTPADALTENKDAYCFAKPGAVYAVYLPRGGTTQVELPDAEYSVHWYNPRRGGELQTGSVKAVRGPGSARLGDPPAEANQDWVALLRFAGEGKPPRVDFDPEELARVRVGASRPGSSGPEEAPVPKANLRIAGFTLVNAQTDRPLKGFEDISGEVHIDLGKLPTRQINVIATTKARVGSVQFVRGRKSQVENVAPYAMEGDTDGDFNGWQITSGTHNITATPFARRGGQGDRGPSLSLTLIAREGR